MKIKHYDQELGRWVIDGASNANDIELTNPSFLDENGTPISTNHGFTKVANDLKRLEDNLAWIYVNGALGGGGGPGGGPLEGTITIDVIGGNTIYTPTQSVSFEIMILNGSIAKSFTVEISDAKTGKILLTTKVTSLRKELLNITGIEKDIDLYITAIDSAYNQAIPKEVFIKVGAISLAVSPEPAKVIDLTSIFTFPIRYTINNKIPNSKAEFILKIDGREFVKSSNLEGTSHFFNYSIRDLLSNPVHGVNAKSGQKITFEAFATTTLNDTVIKSNVSIFSVTVVESNTLVIVTDEIGETKENSTSFAQGSNIQFGYYLSYAPNTYSRFTIEHETFLMDANDEVIERVSKGTVEVTKGVNNVYTEGTVGMEITNPGEYLKIVLFARASAGLEDLGAQYEKIVYATIRESGHTIMTAYNDGSLMGYYSNLSGFPNASTTSWGYKWHDTGLFRYNGPFKGLEAFSDNQLSLHLGKTNGITTGFINTGSVDNIINTIVLNGESYAYLDKGRYLFPNTSIGTGIFQNEGFNLSMTYKASKMSDASVVIMSIGDYRDDKLYSGIEITAEKVELRVGNADRIEVKLPINELITVDFDFSLIAPEIGWYFKIYLNGVLSAVTKIESSQIDWNFLRDIYFGCRNDGKTLSRFSNVSFYDIKLYSKSLKDVEIVQNYISATVQALPVDSKVDPILDEQLRTKNFFTAETGECILWDYEPSVNDYKTGMALYNDLAARASGGITDFTTPYPVMLISETSPTWTDFKGYSSAVFGEGDKETVMGATFPCQITYISKEGRETIITPEGVSAQEGVRVGLQGTSSLSYNSKNYEIYMGNMPDGRPQLFTPTDDWLPENQFTLKADVMDSAHVNNVVIGKIINGEVTDSSGTPIQPLTVTPPMKLSASVIAGPGGDLEQAAEISSKFKHTSDGFPCLLFIEFSKEDDKVLDNGEIVRGVKETRFLGIYNFNLGRHAHYNLGLKLLQTKTKRPKIIDGTSVEVYKGPAVMSDYTERSNYWDSKSIDFNKGETGGVHSMEISQNDSDNGAFKQGDLSIVRHMTDSVYSSVGKDPSYIALSHFYEKMARKVKNGSPAVQKHIFEAGAFKPVVGSYSYDKSQYTFEETTNFLNWDNAVRYYMIMLLFGMVDSTVKNMTLRSWGGEWYPAFYDMDTAFGLNNAGQDTVEYWAHLHKWRNIQNIAGLTSYEQDSFYPYQNPEGVRQYFASNWSRLWEIVEEMPKEDPGSPMAAHNLTAIYKTLRETLFPDPEKFIEKYYKAYTDQTGSIIFNYDYRVKYLAPEKRYVTETKSYIDTTDFSQLKFLHGNRVVHVKDWFSKRIAFFDGIYGSTLQNVDSPSNQIWNLNKATGQSGASSFEVTMQSPSKVLFRWSLNKDTHSSFWIEDKDITASVAYPKGEIVVSMYAANYIKKFSNFKNYAWTVLTSINFPLLKELDLSGLSNMDPSNFLGSDITIGGKGLVSLEKLVLSNLTFDKKDDAWTSYRLGVQNCNYLKHLDLSNSDITSVNLPTAASLKYYNISGTTVPTLHLQGQSFLEDLILTDCDNLTSVILEGCNSLKSLNLPKNVEYLEVINCPLLEELNVPYQSVGGTISNLKTIIIDGCEGLKTFNVEGQNGGLDITLNGAPNLENLRLGRTVIGSLLLPSLTGEKAFNSLKSIDISNTKIENFVYNNSDNTTEYLDLRNFPDLDSIIATNNTALSVIKCVNNPLNPIDLNGQSFFNCAALKKLEGHFRLLGSEVFRNCRSLELNTVDNDPSAYLEGEGVCNLTIATSNLKSMFDGCSSLSYNDFKRISLRIDETVDSLEATFKDCSRINGKIWKDYFRRCKRVVTIKEMFSGANISGVLHSRSSDYNLEDESTWGMLDFLPMLKDATASFERTMVEAIDNNFFNAGEGKYYPIKLVDSMFRNCSVLKTTSDTLNPDLPYGRLNSKDFFTNLDLIAVYPKTMFQGCSKVDMDIINEDENTFLFHTKKNSQHSVLDDSLYDGVNLYGEIKHNVFGGITKTIGDYFIPSFTTIKGPFSGSGPNISVCINDMGRIFEGLGNHLMQAINVFSNMKCVRSTVIPDNIFSTCVELNSIEGLFSSLDIDNDGEIYDFPNSTIFKNNTKLQSIRNLFSNSQKIKIRLVGEGFKNCVLKDVSGAFSRSGVFGVIPYRLFFMVDSDNKLKRTIENMENIFSGCWLLGFDETRELNIGELLEQTVYDGVIVNSRYTTWDSNVAKVRGNPVTFSLPNTMSMTYNYSRDDRKTIPNPNYDQSVPESEPTIPNPKYDPGERHFDSWYLDGNSWLGKTASENTAEFEEQKARMQERYFVYDDIQRQSIIDHEITRWYIKTKQNYMIPTDLFRYCSKNATLNGVLSNLTWYENIIEESQTEARKTVVVNPEMILEGLVGRIPMRLLEDLKDTKKFENVFAGTFFEPFYGLIGTDARNLSKGLMYPVDLFKHNVGLEEVPGVFSNTTIPVGVAVNSNLFEANEELTNISNLWANVTFNTKEYNGSSVPETHSQIPLDSIFSLNYRIANASGLFAVTIINNDQKGLKIVSEFLLNRSYRINDISGMFSNNNLMIGAVPTFKAASYTALNSVFGYLSGVPKQNITNASQLVGTPLWPEHWAE